MLARIKALKEEEEAKAEGKDVSIEMKNESNKEKPPITSKIYILQKNLPCMVAKFATHAFLPHCVLSLPQTQPRGSLSL